MRARTVQGGCLGVVALAMLVFAQCQSAAADPAAKVRSAAAWSTVYEVLQSPRCLNCHPAGDRPLVGDRAEPHPQNVQRGQFGMGRFAMSCMACHRSENPTGAHLPPGAPGWRLPLPSMRLVFEGRSPKQLARQLADPKQNGGKTMAELLHHVTADPLVLWGWDPGEGRAPVPVPHAQFVAAFQAWIDGGCQLPD